VADARAAFAGRLSEAGSPPLSLEGDTWHPNPPGHGIITNLVAPLVHAARQ